MTDTLRADLPVFARELNIPPSEYWTMTIADRHACIEWLNAHRGA